jgi:phosphoribosylformylglycinamidine synthase
MPKNGVLDPQGKAIGHALTGHGFAGIGEVRVGKLIELELAETDPAKAQAAADFILSSQAEEEALAA